MTHTKKLTSLLTLVMLGLFCITAVGCDDGAAEEAGEDLDNAVDDATD